MTPKYDSASSQEAIGVAEDSGFNLALSETLKTGFVASRPMYNEPFKAAVNKQDGKINLYTKVKYLAPRL